MPGFLPPSASSGGWPKAIDNYQRLNYDVARIHQIPASPYMLDVADELGFMITRWVRLAVFQQQQRNVKTEAAQPTS